MENKKTKGLTLLSIYLIIIGFLFISYIVKTINVFPYIVRSQQGRIESIMDLETKETNTFAIKSESNKIKYEKNSNKFKQSVINIAIQTLIKITSFTAYQNIILFFGATFYFLSGFYVIKRSNQYKIFLYLGALSWIIWINIINVIPSTLIENSQRISFLLSEFMNSIDEKSIPYEEPAFMQNILCFKIAFVFITFMLFVALPLYWLSRKSIKDQLK